MKKNNLDILKKLGTGFKSPEGYFETIENDVLSKISSNIFPEKEGYTTPKNYVETIEDAVFVKINKNNKEQYTGVPKNYFETIEDNVFDKIKKENSHKPNLIDLKSRVAKIFTPIAIAASLLLLFILNYNTNNNANSFDNIAATDVENWIENDLVSLDSYQIAEVFDDITLEDEFDEDDIDVLDYFNGTDIESVLLTD